MAIPLYKGDKTCVCDKDQLQIMKDAGWSTEKSSDKAAAKKEESAPVKATSSAASKSAGK